MTTKRKQTNKRGKERVMYRYPDGQILEQKVLDCATPVHVLPATDEAHAERVEQAAKAMYFAGSLGVTWSDPFGKEWREHCLTMAEVMLKAIPPHPAAPAGR